MTSLSPLAVLLCSFLVFPGHTFTSIGFLLPIFLLYRTPCHQQLSLEVTNISKKHTLLYCIIIRIQKRQYNAIDKVTKHQNTWYKFGCWSQSDNQVGGGLLTAVTPPLHPTAEVDRPSIFRFFFFFTIFLFPHQTAPWKPWTIKQMNAFPIYPFVGISVDRMNSSCGFLRFAGEVRLGAPATCWISIDYVMFSRRFLRFFTVLDKQMVSTLGRTGPS